MPDIILKNRPISLSSIRFTVTYGDEYVNAAVANADDLHIHHCAELYINLEGNVSFLVKNELYPISRGDIIFTRANEFHRCVYHDSGIHKHFCLWLSDDDEELVSVIENNELHHIRFSYEDSEKLIKLFFKLYSSVGAKDDLEAGSALLQIFSQLRLSSNSSPSLQSNALPHEFQSVLDYVSESYRELTNVCELCEIFFISPSTLNRWFAKYLKVTPKTYLETIKLSEAKKMLCCGKSVTDTCFDCGFSDLSHFIRVFKRKFGMTPRTYYLNRK